MFMFQLSSHSWVVKLIKITIIIFSYVCTCVCDGIDATWQAYLSMTWFICRKKRELTSSLLQCAFVKYCGYSYARLSINLYSGKFFPYGALFVVNVKLMKYKVDENETDCRYGWSSKMFVMVKICWDKEYFSQSLAKFYLKTIVLCSWKWRS